MSMMSFSSSTMGGGADGQPHTVSMSSSTFVDGNGRRETKQSYDNSLTGDQRRRVERAIGDRARRVTKERNAVTGQETSDNCFIGMEESEGDAFDSQWQQTVRNHTRQIANSSIDNNCNWQRPSSARAANMQRSLQPPRPAATADRFEYPREPAYGYAPTPSFDRIEYTRPESAYGRVPRPRSAYGRQPSNRYECNADDPSSSFSQRESPYASADLYGYSPSAGTPQQYDHYSQQHYY